MENTTNNSHGNINMSIYHAERSTSESKEEVDATGMMK
jgi:hypothetical protein